MKTDHLDVLRKLRQLGNRGGVFQYRQVREAVGVDPADRNTHSRLWVYFAGLVSDGLVEQVPSERKRNRYYRVKDSARLDEILNSRSPAPLGGNGQAHAPRIGAADRLSRVEDKIDGALARLDGVETKLDELIRMWA